MNNLIHAMTRNLDVVSGDVLKNLERYTTAAPTASQPARPKTTSSAAGHSLKIK
jgi:hypothetical protein